MRIVIATSALLLVLGTAAVQGHAFLDHAEPRVGSSVPTAPRQLSLFFTQDLEPAFSAMEVQNSAGARVDQGKPRFGPANAMHIALKPLPVGTYKVSWHVLSVDTHTTEGSFSFHVGAQ